ncbi:MAG: MBL fold metallo-hydrolase [Desulfobacterales bacterium]|nr:MBL fold metallo-hydrolase [Desulfobacterales bacterium]
MTSEKILTIRLGTTVTYLFPGKNGYLLIDGGYRVWDRWFFACLKRAGIRPQQIRLAVITHVHFDHVGTLAAVKNHCQCPIAVHTREAGLLMSGKVVIPPGTNRPGKMVKKLTDRYPGTTSRLFAFEPVKPDVLITAPVSLENLGFEARVIPTPGHTEGSLSIVTSAGNAFVGDIAVNMPLLGKQRYGSPFGYSSFEMTTSLRTLIRQGARRIYPAHGKPFSTADWINIVQRP